MRMKKRKVTSVTLRPLLLAMKYWILAFIFHFVAVNLGHIVLSSLFQEWKTAGAMLPSSVMTTEQENSDDSDSSADEKDKEKADKGKAEGEKGKEVAEEKGDQSPALKSASSSPNKVEGTDSQQSVSSSSSGKPKDDTSLMGKIMGLGQKAVPKTEGPAVPPKDVQPFEPLFDMPRDTAIILSEETCTLAALPTL